MSTLERAPVRRRNTEPLRVGPPREPWPLTAPTAISPAGCSISAPPLPPRPRFGTLQRTMNHRGRLVLGDAVVAVGLPAVLFAVPGHMLTLCSEAEFLAVEQDAASQFLTASVVTITLDRICPSTGRVLIPIALREWAQIGPRSEVAVADLGSTVLLSEWSKFTANRLRMAEALLRRLGLEGDR